MAGLPNNLAYFQTSQRIHGCCISAILIQIPKPPELLLLDVIVWSCIFRTYLASNIAFLALQ